MPGPLQPSVFSPVVTSTPKPRFAATAHLETAVVASVSPVDVDELESNQGAAAQPQPPPPDPAVTAKIDALYAEVEDTAAAAAHLTPRDMAQRLDQHVIGQDEAKRVLATAFRGRHRRAKLSPEKRKAAQSHNVLMLGPTGVGKTEIARQLSALVGAPFVRTEATLYSKVGYHGRDVTEMVNDLAKSSLRLVTLESTARARSTAVVRAEDELYALLHPAPPPEAKPVEEAKPAAEAAPPPLPPVPEPVGRHALSTSRRPAPDTTQAMRAILRDPGRHFGDRPPPGYGPVVVLSGTPSHHEGPRMRSEVMEHEMRKGFKEGLERIGGMFEDATEGFRRAPLAPPLDADTRATFRAQLRSGELNDRSVETPVFVPGKNPLQPLFSMMGTDADDESSKFFERLTGRMETQQLKVPDAFEAMVARHTDDLLDHKAIRAEAVRRTEELGIIFIDEIDKIAQRGEKSTGDVSAFGVQRDLLPLVEGTTVEKTVLGKIRTDNILFVGAGAFSVARPEDLMAEVRGRFPISVELKAHNEETLHRILTEPVNSLISQTLELLAQDGIEVEFTPEATREIAHQAFIRNIQNKKRPAGESETSEDLGARRLAQVVEQVVREVSFEGLPGPENKTVIDAAYVKAQCATLPVTRSKPRLGYAT